MSGSVSPIEHHTVPSQNTRAQKRKLEEILDEVPNHEFDDQLLCLELTTSLNSNEDVVGARRPILNAVKGRAGSEGLQGDVGDGKDETERV